MRIMHITRATLMVCQFMMPLIKEQQRRGHNVLVCGSDDADVETLLDQGVDVCVHTLQRSLNPWTIIKAIRVIRGHIKEHGTEVVVCHSPLGAGVGRIAAWVAGVPHVLYFAHGLPCAPGQNRIKWILWFVLEKLLARVTTGLIVMNRYDQALGEKRIMRSRSRVSRVPGMGICLDTYHQTGSADERRALEEELAIPAGSKIVLCIAYLIPEKGIYVYFQAARKVCLRRSDVHFLIAGDGPQQQALETTVHVTQMSRRFSVLGWRTDVDRLMRCAELFVLPTHYFEGLPVSILEAMACGKPVIATRHRGCEDAVVDQETGYLIPTKDPTQLAKRMAELLDDEALRSRMGRAGRQRVEAGFEQRHCTQVIADVIDRACTP
ncbi:MAG: glycosyltransferase family 4 protein [Planctomycetes bacterium]|nr:glycosyltransferase family 4 protein [Planctomycetota bacterium]